VRSPTILVAALAALAGPVAIGGVGCSSSSTPAAPTDAGSDAVVLRTTGLPQTCTRQPKVTTTTGACNGAPALCDRTYDRVVTPTTHNAYAMTGTFSIANQTRTLQQQLDDGVRGMMLDTDYYDPLEKRDLLEKLPDLTVVDQAFLCHGACLFGSARLLDSLCTLTAFLDAHPEEVLSIIFENRMADEDTEALLQASGLGEYLYTHPSPTTPWPTLASMIASGQRLVVFLEKGGGVPPHLHNAWTNIWDTPYTFASAADFTCKLNRGATTNELFLVNHWLDPPSAEKDAAVNVTAVLGARVEQCTKEAGRPPTFVGVDFYERGDLFDVVRKANGL
jgi:hypothetical protein